MSFARISFGVVAGATSLAIESAGAVAMLWVLLHYLPKDIAGLWLLCLSFMPFFTLAQAGLGPAIVRRIASAKASGPAAYCAEFSLAERAYDWVTLFLVSIFVLIYALYFSEVGASLLEPHTVVLLFSSFVASLLIRLFALRRFQLVIGWGHVGLDRLAMSAGTIVSVGSTYVLLAFTSNVLAAGVGLILGALFFYTLSCFARRVLIEEKCRAGRTERAILPLSTLVNESGGLLILTLVNLVVMSADVWVVERLFGVSQVPAYIAQTKIVFLVTAVAGLAQQMIYPSIAAAWSANDDVNVRKLYKGAIASSWAIGLVGFAVLFTAAEPLLTAWIGPNSFLGYETLCLQLAFGLVYINHVAFAYPVFATGKNPFILASICNAALSLPLSIALGYRMGVTGVVLGNLLGTLLPSIWVVYKSHALIFTRTSRTWPTP